MTVAKLLKGVAAAEQPGLVIMGKQAIDDDSNQTGQMLAALTGWGQRTFASKVVIGDGSVEVTREVDGGMQTVSLKLPAIVTTSSATTRTSRIDQWRSATRRSEAWLRQLIAKRGALGLAPRCLQWSRRGGVPSCVRPAKVRRLPCRLAKKIRAIFKDHAPLVEPLFRDEAYLNVTDNLKGIASAWETAKEIGVRIFEETELIASAGVSRNKFLAKLASDQR